MLNSLYPYINIIVSPKNAAAVVYVSMTRHLNAKVLKYNGFYIFIKKLAIQITIRQVIIILDIFFCKNKLEN